MNKYKKGTMQKLKNKLDELIKLEEQHKVKEQYEEQKKLKGLYETLDFIPLPSDVINNSNPDWED